MIRIQSKDCNIGLYRFNKIYLSSYCDEKYIVKDSYSSFSHFNTSTR